MLLSKNLEQNWVEKVFNVNSEIRTECVHDSKITECVHQIFKTITDRKN